MPVVLVRIVCLFGRAMISSGHTPVPQGDSTASVMISDVTEVETSGMTTESPPVEENLVRISVNPSGKIARAAASHWLVRGGTGARITQPGSSADPLPIAPAAGTAIPGEEDVRLMGGRRVSLTLVSRGPFPKLLPHSEETEARSSELTTTEAPFATVHMIPVVSEADKKEMAEAAAQRVFRRTAARLAQAWIDLEKPTVPSSGGTESMGQGVCQYGPLRLRKLLAQRSDSNLYAAEILNATTNESIQNVMVKYGSDCSMRMDFKGFRVRHSLAIDGAVLSILALTGLVPAVIYVSPPTVVPPWSALPEWLRTETVVSKRQECVKVGAETRFLVMEKAGWTLGDYIANFNAGWPWHEMAHRAVTLVIRVIQMLETIHDLGIVHGDISGRTVRFKSIKGAGFPSWTDTDLVLVDFEFAVLFPDQIKRAVSAVRRPSRNPEHLSPWHLLGSRMGRRDDVFRALEFLAFALSKGAHYRHIRNREMDVKLYEGYVHDWRFAEWKDPKEIFYTVKPNKYVGDPKHRISGELDHIAEKHLDSLTHPDDRPEYDEIVSHLEVVQGILSTYA